MKKLTLSIGVITCSFFLFWNTTAFAWNTKISSPEASDSIKGYNEQWVKDQESNIQELTERIGKVETDVKERTVFGIAIGSVTLLSVLGFAIAIDGMRKSQKGVPKEEGNEIHSEIVKLESKILEIVEKQLSAQQVSASSATGKAEIDHSLTLKVADEITKIEMNLSRMDSSVKGYKQLSKAVQRIKDNFSANGYEIVDMLGKPYNEGMRVVANFVPDDSLEEGKQVITGIIKPQINYRGVMIQAAQITVSQNI